ncbi:glycosyltransferase 87 family protein [Curtobacterium sp. Leaf261]|uniref:glycosyltransferase 87 family protein n=1 Tax=Curtobacterium sp. Leaf261 TaxID=1736311 RepID=UPI000714EBFB|nr:glycosyltransferase 87 family protein [Curtobacterium sp. Leaf261]KQO62156.1 hypothetical protein ASF23_10000 [Curtobacterium sp. Leaf261]
MRRRPLSVLERVLMCVVAVVLTCASAAHKLTCSIMLTNPDGSEVGTLTRVTRYGCYSDLQALWGRRTLEDHLFPYVAGTYGGTPPDLGGGTVEYPTLTGLWVWLSALPVSTFPGFIVATALTFVPVVVVIVLCLQGIAGRRAWIFAATPPLAVYALYNWDLLPVMMTAIGLALVLVGPRRWRPSTRVVLAALAFGIGAAFKLYPAMFVLPLVLAVLLDRGPTPLAARVRTAGAAVLASIAAVAAANVPFMIVNFTGWASVFRFQAARVIDQSTMSIWWWGFLPWSNTSDPDRQHLMMLAATVSTAVGLVIVVVAGVIVGRRTGRMPWVQTSAAMLCVYMLCNKVDSLQYVLWLLPFFVVLRVRTGWIVGYLLADLATFVGWYRSLFYKSIGNVETTWADQALTVGVWGRAVLLALLAVTFLRARVVDGQRAQVDAAPAGQLDDAAPSELDRAPSAEFGVAPPADPPSVELDAASPGDAAPGDAPPAEPERVTLRDRSNRRAKYDVP